MSPRLSSVDAQRVLNVLEECLQNLQYIAYLSKENIAAGTDEIRELLGEELTEDIKELRTLEESCAEILQQPKQKEKPELVAKLEQRYQQNNRVQPSKAFLKHFGEFKELINLKLTTTVEEEKSKQDFLNDIIEKESKVGDELKRLQQQLAELRSKNDRDVAIRNSSINKVKEEIQELGVKSSVDAKRLEQDTATQEFKSSQIHQEKDLVQQKNLQTLSNQLDETIKENKRTTLNYRKKKHKIEKEVENWISKYDVEMQEKEREIQALNSEYEAIRKELAELEQEYNKLLQEQEEIVTKDNKAKEELQIEADKIKRLNHAALVIQKMWQEKHRKIQSVKKPKKKTSKLSVQGKR